MKYKEQMAYAQVFPVNIKLLGLIESFLKALNIGNGLTR